MNTVSQITETKKINFKEAEKTLKLLSALNVLLI